MIKNLAELRNMNAAGEKKTCAVACAHDAHTLEAIMTMRNEGLMNCLLVGHTDKIPECHRLKIVQHPARHHRVEHHQHNKPDEGRPAVDMPLLLRLLQPVIQANRAFLAGSAQRKFHRHNGDTHNHQEYKIEQHERAAAILSRDVREAPNVADTDGTACA